MSRIIWTASKRFSFFIDENLRWRANLERGVTVAQVDSVEAANAIEVDDVAEVPAHERVDLVEGCRGDVLCVREHQPVNHASQYIGLRELPRLRCERHVLDVLAWQVGEKSAHSWRRILQLERGQLRNDEHIAAAPE